jgi:hypothetical protein
MATQVEIDPVAKGGVHLNQKAGSHLQVAARLMIDHSQGQIPLLPLHLLLVMKHRRNSEVLKPFHHNSFLVTQQTIM